MPSKLILQSHYLNQIIANHICPFHYVSWNHNTLQWRYENISWKRMWPFYTILLINFAHTFLFLLTFTYIRWYPIIGHGVSSKQLIMCSFYTLITALVTIVDWLFITSGPEWVFAINWVYRTEFELETTKKLVSNFDQSTFFEMLTCVISGMVLNGDKVGIIFNIIVIYYPVVAFQQYIMFGLEHLDPLYFFASALNLTFLNDSLIFTLFRHLHLFIWNQFVLLNARACILITIGMTVSYLQLLKRLQINATLARNRNQSYKLYQRLTIVLCLLWANVNTVIGACLSLAFFMVVLGICGSIFAYKRGLRFVPLIFYTVSGIALSAVLVAMKGGCFLFNFSTAFLRKWKGSSFRRNEGLFSRQIRACRPLHVKAGNMSIICDRLQGEYLYALLNFTINTLLVFSD